MSDLDARGRTMEEYIDDLEFMIGLDDIDQLDFRKGVMLAFRELKGKMKTPTEKTVPYQPRIKLSDVGIHTKKVLKVFPAYPRIGLTMSSIDSGNVFQVAAAVNTYSAIGNTTSINIDPIMTEMAMAQVRNALTTDFQWDYDAINDIVYCTHRDPRPAAVTVRYYPNFQDVSEIINDTWQNYLLRLSAAYIKQALGRRRSKYKVSDSNVELDGDTLLSEANQEFEEIREELKAKKNRLLGNVLN